MNELKKIAAYKQETKNLKYNGSVPKKEISNHPFAKLEEEIRKLNLKETPAKFFENIYVTRNKTACRKLGTYILQKTLGGLNSN